MQTVGIDLSAEPKGTAIAAITWSTGSAAEAQNQMRFDQAYEWKQVTLQDCQPGGALATAEVTRITTPTLRNALENLAP